MTSFDDLETEDVKDKIVLWNVPFTTYGKTVAYVFSLSFLSFFFFLLFPPLFLISPLPNSYRSQGAKKASAAGAKASLTRSVASFSLYTPHTGVQNYGDSTPIPTAAITVEDAELMGYIQVFLEVDGVRAGKQD